MNRRDEDGMTTLMPGQRLDLGTPDRMTFELSGLNGRSAMAAVLANGSAVPLERGQDGGWSLPDPQALPDTAEIVGYTVDERTDVAFTDLYPIRMSIGEEAYELPRPDKRLGLVVLAEIYTRDGRRRIRIGGDGFSYGVEAYARAKGIEASSMPHRTPAAARRRDGDEASSSGNERSGRIAGFGSGILVAPRTIVTNAHVVDGGTSFLAGLRRMPLELLAVDPIHDLAVLRGDVEGECLRMRESASAWLGEPVIAAGYPLVDVLGGDLKVSMGNVSGLVGTHGDVARLQFTAPVGSGSSGGAVTDEFGNLIGVTSFSISHNAETAPNGVSQNMNFATKVGMVREMLASVGIDVPSKETWTEGGRREAVARLRSAVTNIGVVE